MSDGIRRRGKRSWQVQIELGPDPRTGARRRRFVTVQGTRRDAERARTEALHERDTGIDLRPEHVTLAQYLQRWLTDYAAHNVAPSTLLRYRQLSTRLSVLLGNLRLAEIRPAHVQSAYAALLRDGLAERTVLHHHRMLREALHHAVRWQLLGRNPADAVQPPRPARAEMRTLTSDETGVLMDAVADAGQRRLVYVALATGLRLGELLGLRWSDIDWSGSRATIQRAAQYLPASGVTLRAPKTARGRRSVALSADTLTVLREHRSNQNEARLRAGPAWSDNGLVFARADGSLERPYPVSAAVIRQARGAGFEGLRFHDLRHTAATLMLQAGVHPKIVSERLGHATISLTLDTYSHVLPDMQQEAAAALDRLLTPPPASSVPLSARPN